MFSSWFGVFFFLEAESWCGVLSAFIVCVSAGLGGMYEYKSVGARGHDFHENACAFAVQ